MNPRPLVPATIEQLEAAFNTAKGDYARLKLIADELQRRKIPRAGILRLKVIAEMFRLKREAWETPSPAPPAPPSPLRTLLNGFGIDAPDGRPLHRYGLDTKAYENLEALVRRRLGKVADGKGSDAALLTLWASNWFRLHYTGGIRKYHDLSVAIGINIPDQQWRDLLEQGLKWWKRTLIKRKGHRHRLLTIAVEGGFPVRVLAAGEGWLSRYLNKVVGRLLGIVDEPTEDDAVTMAEASKEELRETFRQEAFIALAADLALAIVRLRRFAEAAAPGSKPSTVLDQIRPGWRDELPIATDSDAARTLIDGMLAAERIARGLSGGAGCVRVLRRRQQAWCAGLRISLGGNLKADALVGLAAPGTRLGVHPYGVLTHALGEELAFLDPPGEDDDSWRLRPLTRKTELDDVPLEARIEVLIQSPTGAARVIPWPGGGPERSDVLTFEIEAEDNEGPTALVLTANGSASLLSERVVITAPSAWSVRWEEETASAPPQQIGITQEGRGLWLVDRAALVESKDHSLLYCIRTGVDEELRDRIVLNGSLPHGIEGADDMLLFSGPPAVHCYHGKTPAKAADNELLWRQSRTEPWCEMSRYRIPNGVVDIIWRDLRTGFVRDRIRTAILPQSARVHHERDGNGCRYSFEGFGEWTISPEPIAGLMVEPRSRETFALTFSNNPQRRVTFVLGMLNSTRTIRITLPYPLRDGLAHWNGKIVPPGSEITPTELAEFVAFGEGRLTICCEFKNTYVALPAHYTLGERELSLRPLAERIRGDLTSAGIDAVATLSLDNGTRPWLIKLFDLEIQCSNGTASIKRMRGLEVPTLTLTGRSVIAPSEEHCLAEISLEDALNRRPISLPGHMTGAWWVYVRSGGAVRSRPSIISTQSMTPPTGSGLVGATAIKFPLERRIAIAERLAAIPNNVKGAEDDILWLRNLINSLNGVPASTFDVLAALPNAPAVLTRLLLSADEIAQTGIWRLEAELPFLWAALPLEAWTKAANAVGQNLTETLLATGMELPQAAPIAKQIVDSAISRASNIDPVIASVLAAARLLPRPSLVPSVLDAAQGYVRRTYDRGDTATGIPKHTSLFRTPSLDPHLPTWFRTQFELEHLEALDAPLAVSAAAKAGSQLTLAEFRRCKEASIADPVYFVEGITAALLGTEK